MLKKLLSVTVIFFLISLTCIPVTFANKSSIKNDFSWGFILDIKTYMHSDSFYDNLNDSWGVAFDFVYFILGIGRHDFNIEFSYNMTILDKDTNKTMQVIDVISFNDELYLFQPSKDPMIKIKATDHKQTDIFLYLLEVYCTVTIESNGELIYMNDFYYNWE